MSDPYTDQAKVLAALSAENGVLRIEIERLRCHAATFLEEQTDENAEALRAALISTADTSRSR
jgi:hypothetical protein